MFGKSYLLRIHEIFVLGFELCDAEGHVQASWILAVQLVCNVEFLMLFLCFVTKPSVIHNWILGPKRVEVTGEWR